MVPYKFGPAPPDGNGSGSVDLLKSAFAKVVITERGDRLLISEDELVQGRIYMGLEAERLGLVDEIGGDSDAFEKAADLAGISNYGLVDVNLAVLKKNVRDMRKVYQTEAEDSDSSAIAAALHRDYTALPDGPRFGAARRRFLPDGGSSETDSIRNAGHGAGKSATRIPVGHQQRPPLLLPVHWK